MYIYVQPSIRCQSWSTVGSTVFNNSNLIAGTFTTFTEKWNIELSSYLGKLENKLTERHGILLTLQGKAWPQIM